MMTSSQETTRQAPPPPLHAGEGREGAQDSSRESPGRNRRILVLLPLAVFLGLAALFFVRLSAGD
jgi:hypothetical protein